MEDHVDRKAKMGTRVLINDGWYETLNFLQILVESVTTCSEPKPWTAGS
jgi:hypothetical protein